VLHKTIFYKCKYLYCSLFINKRMILIYKSIILMKQCIVFNIPASMYVLACGFIIIPLEPVFLDIILPLNESRPRIFAVKLEFRVDKNEYFLPLFCYITLITVVGMSIMVSVDAMHITCTAHACGLFAVVR